MTGAAQTVGTNLRRLRIARGLSLVELGRLSGLAKGTLTQLEAGRANPTIETLQALAGALAVALTDLVADPPLTAAEVVRADEGQVTTGHHMEARMIRRTHLGSMIAELFEMRFSPGPTYHAGSHAAGVVEQVYVLEGTIAVGPEGRDVLLGPGDFVRFPADQPHSYAAPEREARVLMWQLLPALPTPATSVPGVAGSVATVEALVPRAPGTPVGEPLPVPPPPGPRPLPQPPVRGRRPPSRTLPGPRPDHPRPPGPGR